MGKSRQTQTTNSRSTQSQSNRFDPNVINSSNFAIDRAREIADREFTPYTGDRIAALSSNEAQGIGLARQGYDEANDYFRRGAVGFDTAFSSGRLQPYLDNLANPMVREINRDYEQRKSDLAGRSAMLNAFGGSRYALQQSELDRNYDDAVSDARGAAFDRAIGVFQNDQNRLMQAGGALAQTQSQQVQDLMETGYVDRVLRQSQADFDYGQFLENRDWDITNLQPLLQTLAAVPKNTSSTGTASSTTTSTVENQPDTFGQLVGAAATVAGAYFTGGASLALGAGQNALSQSQSMGAIQSASPLASTLFGGG